MCCFKTSGEKIALIQNYFELLIEHYNKPKIYLFISKMTLKFEDKDNHGQVIFLKQSTS